MRTSSRQEAMCVFKQLQLVQQSVLQLCESEVN